MKPIILLIATSIFIGNFSAVLAADSNAKTSTNANTSSATVKADASKSITVNDANAAASSTVGISNGAAASTAVNSASTAADKNSSDASKSASSTGTEEKKPEVTKWKPGIELSVGTDTQDLVPTDDVDLAKKQVDAYPDSPEARFILAVALTRTSRVEEALKEVRTARKLAEAKGGTTYFDQMILTYEDMLKNYPNENRVRYGLAWAYYMKAYLLANYSKKVAAWKAKNGDPNVALANAAKAAASSGSSTASGTSAGATKAADQLSAAQKQANLDAAKNQVIAATQKGKPFDINGIMGAVGALAQGNTSALPKIPSVMDNVDPADVPQIRKFYEQGLSKLDELIAQKPDDVWALVYRAHLRAEYDGNLEAAMNTWKQCSEKFPNNPAAYFFLGEGYLKQGNLKESISNVSKAVALRGMGN